MRNFISRFNRFDAVLIGITLTAVALFSFYPPTTSHAADARVMVFSETYDAADTADGAGITNPIAAPGAALGDACVPSVYLDVVDVSLTCNVISAGVAEVRMQNESGSSVNLASATWRVFILPRGTR